MSRAARGTTRIARFGIMASMRIISGSLGGRNILPPPSDKTRPITDRAKQSLFDALQNCFEGGKVLDCFSGTGSMGLECLSRGGSSCIFVERDRGALKNLRQNIDDLQLKDKAIVLPVDAYAGLVGHPDVRDLVVAFVDPPYIHMEDGFNRNKVDALIRGLAEQCMTDGGIISIRHHVRASVDPGALGVKVIRELVYGDMGITWVTRNSE